MDKTRTRTVDDSHWSAGSVRALATTAGGIVGLVGGPIGAGVGAAAVYGITHYATYREKDIREVVINGVTFERNGGQSAPYKRDFVSLSMLVEVRRLGVLGTALCDIEVRRCLSARHLICNNRLRKVFFSFDVVRECISWKKVLLSFSLIRLFGIQQVWVGGPSALPLNTVYT